MDNYFDPDSWVMVKLSELADLIILNVLWLITSLPVFTIGASTAALYACVKTPGERQYASSVIRKYFSAFGRNFRKATCIFLVLLIPMALVVCNTLLLLFGLLEDGIVNYVICGISLLLFLFIWVYVFPLTAGFENTVFKTIGNALVLSVSHLPSTVLMTVLTLIPAAVLIFFTNFFYKSIMIWLFLAFALIAKINSFFLERIFDKYMPAQAPGEE